MNWTIKLATKSILKKPSITFLYLLLLCNQNLLPGNILQEYTAAQERNSTRTLCIALVLPKVQRTVYSGALVLCDAGQVQESWILARQSGNKWNLSKKYYCGSRICFYYFFIYSLTSLHFPLIFFLSDSKIIRRNTEHYWTSYFLF